MGTSWHTTKVLNIEIDWNKKVLHNSAGKNIRSGYQVFVSYMVTRYLKVTNQCFLWQNIKLKDKRFKKKVELLWKTLIKKFKKLYFLNLNSFKVKIVSNLYH